MLLWIGELLSTQSVANAVLVLSLVAALGLALGSVPVAGISLGIGGVLFAGLAFGYLGFQVDPHILHFVREFGLILFIFTMGMQVGPGFFSSLRRQGLRLNALAAAIVLIGALLTLGLVIVTGMPMETAVGLYTPARPSTPRLLGPRKKPCSVSPQTPRPNPQASVMQSRIRSALSALFFPCCCCAECFTSIRRRRPRSLQRNSRVARKRSHA